MIGDAGPAAPELAKRGLYAIGIRTVDLLHKNQKDIVHGGVPYDRPLKLEIWYPARIGQKRLSYSIDYIGKEADGDAIPYRIPGRAVRNGKPDTEHGSYPLIVVSHGFPGSRMLMSYIGENLSTKGYVVAAISHTDTTYEDPVCSFDSAKYHRPLDQQFALDCLLEPEKNGMPFLHGMIDKDKVGLIGYSMGGYGVLRTLGADIGTQLDTPTCTLSDEPIPKEGDKRFKAAVLFAPWATQLMAEESYTHFTQPTLWVVCTNDMTVGYPYVVNAFEKAVHSDRYLLTFKECGHNVAPNPAPKEAQKMAWKYQKRWADCVWDGTVLNNINEHFLTAFFDLYLKGDKEKAAYLEVKEQDADIVHQKVDGEGKEENLYWKGFKPGSLAGLVLQHRKPE